MENIDQLLELLGEGRRVAKTMFAKQLLKTKSFAPSRFLTDTFLQSTIETDKLLEA
jgi:hypothetical protein